MRKKLQIGFMIGLMGCMMAQLGHAVLMTNQASGNSAIITVQHSCGLFRSVNGTNRIYTLQPSVYLKWSVTPHFGWKLKNNSVGVGNSPVQVGPTHEHVITVPLETLAKSYKAFWKPEYREKLYLEVIYGAPPPTPGDSDGDGLSDEEEANEASDPNNPDTDGDGLLDGEEFWVWGTSTTAVDSDLDGVWDGIETGMDVSINGLTNLESEVEPPGDLTLVDEITNCVSLSWQDFSTNEVGFILERKQMTNSWQIMTVLPLNVTNYYDYLYEPEQNGEEVVYAYRIKTLYAPNDPNGKMRTSRASNTTHSNREQEKPMYIPIDLHQGGYGYSKAIKVNEQGQALVLCNDYGEDTEGVWVRWNQGQAETLNGAILQADMNENGTVVASIDQGIRIVPAVWSAGSGSATPLNVPILFGEDGEPFSIESQWGVGWVIDDSGQVWGLCQSMFDVEYESANGTETHSLPLFAAHHWNSIGGIPQPLAHPHHVQWGIRDVSGSGTKIGQRWNKVGENWQDHYYVGGQNVSFVPESINNAGMVAGTDENHSTAILWQGTVQSLGGGWARAVNEEGLVVGHDHSGNQAYLWKKNIKTDEYERFTVNETLPQQQQAEWNVTEAHDVNGAGMVVGQGVNQGKDKATLLSPADVVVRKKGQSVPKDGVLVKKGDVLEIALSEKWFEQPKQFEDMITWQYQQLKSDGSYEEWTDFGANGKGTKFEYTTQISGIFQVKAVLDSGNGQLQDCLYVRKKDEEKNGYKYGLGKKGEPDAFGVADTQIQFDLRNEAKNFYASTAYPKGGVVPAQYGFPQIGSDTFKCNIFVAHRGNAVGAIIPKINGYFNEYPPLANEWAGTEDTSIWPGDPTYIAGWPLLPVSTYPQPGWIIASPAPVGPGHCGIIDYDGKGIGAESSSQKVGKIYNFYAHSPRFRKYE